MEHSRRALQQPLVAHADSSSNDDDDAVVLTLAPPPLPPEVLRLILRLGVRPPHALGPRDLCAFAHVCRAWNDVADDDVAWRVLCRRHSVWRAILVRSGYRACFIEEHRRRHPTPFTARERLHLPLLWRSLALAIALSVHAWLVALYWRTPLLRGVGVAALCVLVIGTAVGSIVLAKLHVTYAEDDHTLFGAPVIYIGCAAGSGVILPLLGIACTLTCAPRTKNPDADLYLDRVVQHWGAWVALCDAVPQVVLSCVALGTAEDRGGALLVALSAVNAVCAGVLLVLARHARRDLPKLGDSIGSGED